ncbi:MAG: translocase [Eggerthellaceae bacterium]
MAKTLGKAISKFRSAQEEMNKVLKTEVYDPVDEPFKNTWRLSKVGESAKTTRRKTELLRRKLATTRGAQPEGAKAKKAGAADGCDDGRSRYGDAAAAKPVAKPDGSFAKPEEPKAAELRSRPPSLSRPPAKPSPDETRRTRRKKRLQADGCENRRLPGAAKPAKPMPAAHVAAAKKAAATRAANRAAAEAAAKANKNERE